MIQTHRKRIALFLSFVMVALLLCQGMAQAALLGEMSRPAAAATMTCHDMGMKVPAASHGKLCPSDCQHLDKASGSLSLSADLGNLSLLATAFWLPAYSPAETIQIVSLAPSPHSPDPPPLIRFQHFRI
jgi:hypothetical protein